MIYVLRTIIVRIIYTIVCGLASCQVYDIILWYSVKIDISRNIIVIFRFITVSNGQIVITEGIVEVLFRWALSHTRVHWVFQFRFTPGIISTWTATNCWLPRTVDPPPKSRALRFGHRSRDRPLHMFTNNAM